MERVLVLRHSVRPWELRVYGLPPRAWPVVARVTGARQHRGHGGRFGYWLVPSASERQLRQALRGLVVSWPDQPADPGPDLFTAA